MSRGLQALVSYSLAKSSDLGSTDADGVVAASVNNIVLPPLTPSDFDIRHTLAGAASYEIPTPSWGRAGKAIFGGWAIDALVRAPKSDAAFSYRACDAASSIRAATSLGRDT
jgi:hypothetical protein